MSVCLLVLGRWCTVAPSEELPPAGVNKADESSET